ncbi:MAG: GNAT family N-acetyltransferase [Acholeplasmataceae bacterium]|nr:GNAT family N-acetyltransferase [Acholeplasmataceae bacterium]
MTEFKSFISNNFEVKLANTEEELKEVFKLRYEELLLSYNQENTNQTGMFIDDYDEYSDHLIVVDLNKKIIAGTYRLVKKEHIKTIGMFITEKEFDLTKIKDYEVIELGRAVVRKEYRDGTAIALLWQGIVRYVTTQKIRFLFGTASFYGVDPNKYKQALSLIYYQHLSPAEFRCQAITNSLPLNLVEEADLDLHKARREMPPLIKGYIKIGATFGDQAFLDYDFNSLDVFTLFDMNNVNPLYLHRFLK